jgi:hypothetical protein
MQSKSTKTEGTRREDRKMLSVTVPQVEHAGVPYASWVRRTGHTLCPCVIVVEISQPVIPRKDSANTPASAQAQQEGV